MRRGAGRSRGLAMVSNPWTEKVSRTILVILTYREEGRVWHVAIDGSFTHCGCWMAVRGLRTVRISAREKSMQFGVNEREIASKERGWRKCWIVLLLREAKEPWWSIGLSQVQEGPGLGRSM